MKTIIIIILIIVSVGLLINNKYDMTQNNLDQDKASIVPTVDTSRNVASFNYPGTYFQFNYPLPASKGFTIAEIKKDTEFDVKISGNDLIKVTVSNEKEISKLGNTNPHSINYRTFIDNKTRNTHIVFYSSNNDAKTVEIVLSVSDQNSYLKTIIETFEFMQDANPNIYKSTESKTSVEQTKLEVLTIAQQELFKHFLGGMRDGRKYELIEVIPIAGSSNWIIIYDITDSLDVRVEIIIDPVKKAIISYQDIWS